MRDSLLAFALVAATSPVTTSAQTHSKPDKAAEMFLKADVDKDGVLSADEWRAAGRKDRGFKMADANKDGSVTPDELRTLAAKYGR